MTARDAFSVHLHYQASLMAIGHLPKSEVDALCPVTDLISHQHYLLLPFDLDSRRDLPHSTLLDLGVAAYALYRMAVAIDAVIDEGRTRALRFALINAELSSLLIARHIPTQHVYWKTHRLAYDAMWRAADIESKVDQASLSDLDAIRVSKSHLLELPVHWHAALSAAGNLNPLAAAILTVGKTFQAMDDISDFHADLRAGKTTFAIRATADHCAASDVDLREQSPEMQLRLLILTPSIREDLQRLRDATLDAALTIGAHGMQLWSQVAERGIRQMDRYLEAIRVAHAPLEQAA
jgi:hypothetical protein